MDWNLPTFQRMEICAWAVLTFILVFFFGHVFVFIGIVVGVRFAYIRFKNSKLEFLETKGKSVVVTGCDTGFGFHLALRLCNRGFHVFATCLDPNSKGAKTLKAREATNRMTILHLDVTSDAMVQQVLEKVQMKCHATGLWGLINNAGQDFIGDAEMTTIDQYLQVANVNLFGMVRTSKALLPLLRKAKGRIINVTSVKGLITVPVTGAYAMTKYGGEAFSEALRQEMAAYGVKVILLEPGNFGGITGCLNDDGIARIKEQLDAQWKEASDEAKQFYGRAHLQKHLEEAKKAATASYPTTEPVVEAVEDALRNVCPSVRYLVGGSNSYIDIYTTLARLSPFLPQSVFDKVQSYFFPYVIYK